MLSHLRKRLALALCRAAGLTTIAANRAELDDLRDSNRKLTAARVAEMQLLKTIAQQTNSNTLMLKRWLEGSPTLQLIEKSASIGGSKDGKNRKSIIVPPTGDLRGPSRLITSKTIER